MTAVCASPVKIGTLHRLTRLLPFFQHWTVPQLKAIADSCFAMILETPLPILELKGVEPYQYFLVKGEVQLESSSGEIRLIKSGELDAGFPIAHVRPRQYHVTAAAGSQLLRIEASKLKKQLEEFGAPRLVEKQEILLGEWREHPLVQQLIQHAASGQLELPAMPGIALRVRRALAQENYRIDEVASIISADPAIVARLLKIANSATFTGQSPCESVKSALVRLGVDNTQSIIMSLAARDLFSTKNAALKTLMMKRWRHAIDVASVCAVLSKLTPKLQNERGMLVGLLHEIGALPIIRAAEAHPDLLQTPDTLNEILTQLTPELTDMILQQWGFNDDFRGAAQHQNNWYYDHEGHADYTDMLVVAHLHTMIGDRQRYKLPRIDETPAFGKLALGELSPELSICVLDEAKAHIQELKTLLS